MRCLLFSAGPLSSIWVDYCLLNDRLIVTMTDPYYFVCQLTVTLVDALFGFPNFCIQPRVAGYALHIAHLHPILNDVEHLLRVVGV
jgi:hypothetical protein